MSVPVITYTAVMGRWQPGTRARLHTAAVRLFTERGYEETTAADIAEAAGVTERTFFRHFPDKREVLFDGQDRLIEAVARGVKEAPADAAPLDVAVSGVVAAVEFFDEERRPYARMRQLLVDAHPALQERERNKLAQLADVVHRGLLDRGVTDPAATLAAESAVVVFRSTIAQWLREDEQRPFDDIARETLASLRAVAGVPVG